MRQRFGNSRIWLAAILLSAGFLRLWDLWKAGLHHDAALNAMRALGWFDFLVGKGQTTPLVWFGLIPWWGNLSFHDHPPLSFLFQRVFFFFFGDSSFVALLPFALAGVITAWIIFRILKEQGQVRAGYWAAAIFAVSSYAVWSVRSGYLEGLEILWISLSVFFLSRYVSGRRNRDLYFWAIAAALALLTKYTAVFLLPAAGVYFVVWERRVLANKHFWLAVLTFLFLLSPIIVYNSYVFAARGHFDAALSSMVGMSPADYSTLAYRSLSANHWTNLANIFHSVRANTSPPLTFLFVFSILCVFWQTIRRRAAPLVKIVLLNILTLSAMFAFSGAADRFVPILLPFLAIFAGQTIAAISDHFSSRLWFGKLWLASVAAIVLLESLYSVNTNILLQPLGSPGSAYAASRFNADGFEDLEKYLRLNALGRLGPRSRVNQLTEQTTQYDLSDQEVVLFDERANWFSRVWYVDRFVYYYRKPIIYFTDLNNALAASANPQENFLAYLRRGGAKGVWVVLAAGSMVNADSDSDYGALMRQLDAQLTAAGVLAREIKNFENQTVFRIFHFR